MTSAIWTEKYRPLTLGEVVNQKHAVERLQSWVKEGSVPHMMFAGPAGTGKTTIALALTRELFKDHWRDNILELNASDERGINIVRGAIKDFAKTRSLASEFKIIFLDESDALTQEAQHALRRTMEQFASSTRFILSCNYSSKIIEPLQSRCAVFRFKRLSQEDVAGYVKRIAEKESLTLDDDAITAIYEISRGDLRKATNLLQTSAALGKVTRDGIYQVASQAKPQDIKDMLTLALEGKYAEARKKLYALLIEQGLAGDDVIRGIHRELFSLDIPEEKRLQLIEKTGEAAFRINQGGSEEIQIEALLAQFLKK